jgi:hypothetical protein
MNTVNQFHEAHRLLMQDLKRRLRILSNLEKTRVLYHNGNLVKAELRDILHVNEADIFFLAPYGKESIYVYWLDNDRDLYGISLSALFFEDFDKYYANYSAEVKAYNKKEEDKYNHFLAAQENSKKPENADELAEYKRLREKYGDLPL